VKRLGFGRFALMLATMCAAQSSPLLAQANAAGSPQGAENPHRGAPAGSGTFEQLCGIADAAPRSAIGLSRTPEGEWSVVTAGKRPGPRDNAAARVWRESNWLVDLHDAPGPAMHAAQMCFGASGYVILMTDDYMDVHCACIRYTAQSFDENGKVRLQSQRFINAKTGAEIPAPESAKGFPEVYGFRRVEQLPFYSLVKN
jgi:hypothetical protein